MEVSRLHRHLPGLNDAAIDVFADGGPLVPDLWREHLPRHGTTTTGHCQLGGQLLAFLSGVMNHLELFPLLPIPLTGILNLGRHGPWRRFPAELGRLELFRRPSRCVIRR